MDLRGGSAIAEPEAPENEVCDAAKKASSDAEKYVQEQLEFWNSLTPEQVRKKFRKYPYLPLSILLSK